MKKKNEKKISLKKFTVVKLVNSSKIIGGNRAIIEQGDTIYGDSTRFCNG